VGGEACAWAWDWLGIGGGEVQVAAASREPDKHAWGREDGQHRASAAVAQSGPLHPQQVSAHPWGWGGVRTREQEYLDAQGLAQCIDASAERNLLLDLCFAGQTWPDP
jgi:hypothetical protein